MSDGVKRMVAMLDKVKGIVAGDRNEAYGEPGQNHGCTAAMFNAYINRKFGTNIELTARDVCWLNILQKASREAHWSQPDNAIDAAGYAANAEACCDGPE